MRLTGLIAALGLFGFGAGLAAADPLIVSGHPNYPPISWEENGVLVGAATKLAHTVFTELNVPFEIKGVGPWKRVQENAKGGSVDVINAAYINEERLKYLDYTTPFMKDPNVIFVWKGRAFPFNTWEDLVGKRGTTNIGESYEEKFDAFAAERLTLERVSTTVQNFKKLEAGRADYFLSGLYPGLAVAMLEGYDEKVEVLPKQVVAADFCMAFSKKSPYAHLIPRVNKIIRRCKAEGLIDKWIKEYMTYYKQTRKKR